jgi:hypothetical protein
MLLKINNNDYLDFDGDVAVERQCLLMQDITSSVGDFSYSIILPPTDKNKSLLDLSDVRISGKSIYRDVPCEVQNYYGSSVYRGFLRVDRASKKQIEATFFSGNTNWITAIGGKCIDLDLFSLGVEKTEANIQASWSNTSGLIFPLLDAGLFFDRVMSDATLYPNMYVEDFQGCVYGKTVFTKIFNDAGIKVEGELLSEFLFNNLVFSCNNVSGNQDLLYLRAARAGKTSNQNIGTVYTQVTFTDATTFPGYNNGFYNTATSEWTADVPMRVSGRAYVTLSAAVVSYLAFRKNGSPIGGVAAVSGTTNTTVLGTRGERDTYYIDLAAGDVLTVEFRVTTGTVNVQAGSFIEVTPIAFLNVVPQSLLGSITKSDFVESIFRMFNVVPKYNEISKTITCNLFKRIKEKTTIEISGETIDDDYSTFISEYGKKTFFNYSSADIDEIEDYNRLNDSQYGGGVIEIDNDYIQDSISIDIDFSTGFNYQNDVLGAYLTNYKFREFEEDGDELTITGNITTGAPNFRSRFTTSTNHGLAVDDWVRIKTTNTGEYVGNGKVIAVPAATTFEITRLSYGANITSGTCIKLEVVENNTDSVFAMICIPNATVLDFSANISSVYFNSTSYSAIAYSYTNFPYNSLPINNNLETIYFDNVNQPSFNQVGLIQNYYSDISIIFNDPVMKRVNAYIPEATFLNMSSLVPIKYHDENGMSLYYLNRIIGYINSWTPCEVELIKL